VKQVLATLDDIGFDDDGEVDGFQFDGRERRMQEWREKKEGSDFDRLVAKLKQKKKYRAWYDRHKHKPEFKQKMRESNARQRAKHRARRNAEDKKKRAEKAEESPIVNICEQCGKRFIIPFGFKKKRTSRFCTLVCRNKDSHIMRKQRRAASRKVVGE
jgi:Skp family chaperone for outer membrane proteins